MCGFVGLTKSLSLTQHRLSEFFKSISALSNSYSLFSAPLLPNILPHFQTLLNFVINTLPKPVLIALLYRLTILHLASRILPTIGANNWESGEEVNSWNDRPVRLLTMQCKLRNSTNGRTSRHPF